MSRKIIFCLLPCLIAVSATIIFVGACSRKSVDSPDNGGYDVTVNVKMALPEKAGALEYGMIVVTAIDIPAPILGILELINGFLVGAVAVPPGRDRKFEVTVFDEKGHVVYRGETTTDVAPMATIALEINLYPQVPMVKTSPRVVHAIQSDRFALDLKVYNMPSLNSITVSLFWTNYLVYPDSALPGPEVSATALFNTFQGNNYYSVTVSERNQTGIVDDSGYAYLATVYFSAYSSDLPIDTSLISVEPGWISNTASDTLWINENSGDTVSLASLYADGSTIELVAAGFYLVGYWPMNETTGDTVFDILENGLDGVAHGTLIGNGIYGSTYADYARYFNGVNDYIEVPDNDKLDITEGITISLWVLVDPSETEGVLISKRVADGDMNYSIKYDATLWPRLSFIYGPPPGIANTLDLTLYDINLADSSWHNIIVSVPFDSLASTYWMIDWAVAKGEWPTGAIIPRARANDAALQWGRQLSEDGQYFGGGLDGIEIYRAYLSPRIFEPQ
jgi:hypothetical protein